ncbi:MAG: hypothetical protein ACQGVC_19990 [Myxococcota bacterium]
MPNWAFRVSHWAAKLAELHPPTGIRLAGPLGYRLGPAAGPRRSATPEMIQRIWKELSPAEVEEVRRRMARQEFRNRTIRRIYKKNGTAGVASRVSVDPGPLPGLLEQGRGVIVSSWHLGPSRAVSLGLNGLGLDLVYATFSGPAGEEDLDGLPYFEIKGDHFYARFLKSAVDTLRSGGVVGMSLDAAFGKTEPMSFLGGMLPTPRGAAALARISGAPMVPVTSRWSDRGGRMQVKLHDPLPEPDVDRGDRDAWERAMMESALHWFADFLRANPELVRLKELKRYVRD